MKKWLEYLVSELFSNRKWCGLGPWLVDHRRARCMVDRPPWPEVELTGARPSGCFGPQLLASRWGKEGGCHGDSILPSTESWKAARRRQTSGGTLAWKGDGVGMVGTKRRGVGSVGIFTGGRAAFYRVKARRGRRGAFNGQR
jgi:hypothetical protein